MSTPVEISVPALGDFHDVPIIDVLVKPGDRVKPEDPLITLETDKATMDVPAPRAGVVRELRVKTGDKVSEGTVIMTLEAEDQPAAAAPSAPAAPQPSARPAAKAEPPAPKPSAQPEAPPAPYSGPRAEVHGEVVVIGGGPGGYTAAFRAADLGKQVVLIERYPTLGGVCLNVGCIPSKALLHVAKVITDAEEMSGHGVKFGAPEIQLDKLRAWKAGVVKKLTTGLAGLARQRRVTVVQGTAKFASDHTLSVETKDGTKMVSFENCIIAAGSSVARIPGFPYDDPRLIDSTGALELPQVPKRMLVIGGGIIGLEMATVYDALGAKVTVVELLDGLMPGADRDIVRPLEKRIAKRYEGIQLKTRVAKIEPSTSGLTVTFEGAQAAKPQTFDQVLMAVGRRPNGRALNAEAAGVSVNERGYIPVDRQMRTNVQHIYAIGDVVGEPMLAHKATHEAHVAAEVIAGHTVAFDARTIPSVAYTDPEVAWMGLTETQAQAQGIEYDKAVFPWAASGRAIAMGREEGMTKLLFDKATKRMLGASMVGINAGELIAEAVLALEMGADAMDVALTIHPHPTLSETVFFASEMAAGTITDLYLPRKPKA
jgi:dihydrolipoamide dehydrogenase